MAKKVEQVTEDDYVVATGRERLRAGRRAIAHARYLVDIAGADAESEEKARSGLASLRSAMNWLEDTPAFEEAHRELDAAGTFVRETFGCILSFEDGAYWQDCPVALAHNRVGLSPAMVIGAAECSICSRDPEDDECPHVKGRVYDGERCIRIITKIDSVLEVSLVGRPAQPDARIQRMSIDTRHLAAALDDRFEPGVPVNCDRCLLPCDGVARPFEESRGDEA